MSQTSGEYLATLEPLEPLESGGPEGAPGAMTADEAMLQAMRSGLPAPAINPYCRDKSYYAFLWAGILMLVGCIMPFDANYAAAGYQTMTGAIYMLIAIGMIRTWWGAINTNRSGGSSILWLLVCFVPLVATIMKMAAFDPAKAFEAASSHGFVTGKFEYAAGWGSFFGDIGGALAKDEEAAIRVGNFWRLLGPGSFFVFLGALIAELGFVGGVLGGAKKNKQLKQAKMAAAAEKRRQAKS
ncbi:MAG: hypothetical protein KDE27_07180 [Planctomycetes bacterium]|nr:hypothetical protein [Planctomycetota bacterium]